MDEKISEIRSGMLTPEQEEASASRLESLSTMEAGLAAALGSSSLFTYAQATAESGVSNRKACDDLRSGIERRRAEKKMASYRRAIEMVDRERAKTLIQDLELETDSGNVPMIQDNDMTCECGRPLLVVVEGAMVGCAVCRTVERIHSKLVVGAAAPSSRAARASRSPGTSIEMISTQSESRIRDLMMTIQGQGKTPAKDEDVERTADWMVKTNRHPLIPHAKKIVKAFNDRHRKEWASWDEAERDLGSQVVDSLRKINGPYTREARTLMKREGAKIATYDDSQAIATKLVGLRPPRISSSLFEYVCSLLRHAYPVYESASKSGDNFWGGYPYFLRCIFLLLGRDEYLQYINLPSLKNKEEIRQHLWQALDWEFVPADPRVEVKGIEYKDDLEGEQGPPTLASQVLVVRGKRSRRVFEEKGWSSFAALRSGCRARVSVKRQ